MSNKLIFRYSAMNSGKSTNLLQVAHNYEERGMDVIILKPRIDTKGNNKIVSRIGIDREVDYTYTREDNLLKIINNFIKEKGEIKCVLVDEAQFSTKEQINQLYKSSKMFGTTVICYGLRTDFKQEGFEGSKRLVEIADNLEELKTICECGKKATHNIRLKDGKPIFDGEQIEIDNGSTYTYESVCGSCMLSLRHREGVDW